MVCNKKCLYVGVNVCSKAFNYSILLLKMCEALKTSFDHPVNVVLSLSHFVHDLLWKGTEHLMGN